MTTHKPSKGLHITLWICQIVLAAMFLMAGFMKLTTPIDKLSETIPWAKDVSAALVRFIGASELLGALGLVLPALLRVKTWLTPLAAVGIALIMIFAIVFHVLRGEMSATGFNVIIMVLALFVAWGRYGKAPIRAKKA